MRNSLKSECQRFDLMKEQQCFYDWILFSASVFSIRIDEQRRKQAIQQRLDQFITADMLPVSSKMKILEWKD